MLGEVEKRLEELGPEERRAMAEIIGRLAELAMEEPLGEFRAVEAALDALPRMGESSDDPPSEAALHAARTRNAVRVLADRARLRKECVRASVVAEALGVSRQRLHRMREEGQLVALLVRERRAALYPYWQFTGEGDVVDGLERLVRASREAGMGPETLHFFMTEPNERLGGERPADLLRRGELDRVVDVLRSSGLGPF
jgi:hypothetical protein